jgi:two-component system sensor histidine kinase BaeS
LTADIAHELRTPLTILQGTLEGLVEGMVESTPSQLSSLHDETIRLTRIVSDLETLAAADAAALTLSRKTIDVADVARRAAAALEVQFGAVGLELRTSLPPTPVAADPDRLRQVVSNLLTNALKFTPAGGSVTMAVRSVGDHVELSVSDTGVGIAEADLPRVFDRFWRGTHEGGAFGSGIGLTVVAELVRAHGGTVTVESELGRGTTMLVTLPRHG